MTRFLSNGVRTSVRPYARSPYSVSHTARTTSFTREKRRWRGCSRRSWHNTGAKRCYEIVAFFSYLDEIGNRLRLVLVGAIEDSIFQGNILVSETVSLEHFPSLAGKRLFLIDAPESIVEALAETLPRTMGGYGMDIATTAGRLNEFNSVNNTYLNIFFVLGGLGVLVSGIGLCIVVLRNCAERRGELALLQAIGFAMRRIRGLVLIENVLPLLFGVGVGTVSALLAVAPSLGATGWGSVGPTLILILIIGYRASAGLQWRRELRFRDLL